MATEENAWRTQTFRQNVVQKIDEAMRSSGMPTSKNSMEMEKHVFQKAKSREEYLGFVARLILHVREMNSKKGSGMNGPGGGGGPNMQDPINALQTLARQGTGNQLMGMVPPPPQNQVATNLLQTLNQRPILQQKLQPGSVPRTDASSKQDAADRSESPLRQCNGEKATVESIEPAKKIVKTATLEMEGYYGTALTVLRGLEETVRLVGRRDEFSIFGEYVADELRTINDPLGVLLLKKKIQDTIFCEKMKALQNRSPQCTPDGQFPSQLQNTAVQQSSAVSYSPSAGASAQANPSVKEYIDLEELL